jgi:hypothetical protein
MGKFLRFERSRQDAGNEDILAGAPEFSRFALIAGRDAALPATKIVDAHSLDSL